MYWHKAKEEGLDRWHDDSAHVFHWQTLDKDNGQITPPRKLVAQWIAEGNRQEYCTTDEYLIDKVAQWGYEQRGAVNEAALQKARDEELEACCRWLAYELRHEGQSLQWADDLRALRRPKPKGQAEEALEALEAEDSRRLWSSKTEKRFDTIRAALERLRELEQSNG